MMMMMMMMMMMTNDDGDSVTKEYQQRDREDCFFPLKEGRGMLGGGGRILARL